jgi:hypothetical protein
MHSTPNVLDSSTAGFSGRLRFKTGLNSRAWSASCCACLLPIFDSIVCSLRESGRSLQTRAQRAHPCRLVCQRIGGGELSLGLILCLVLSVFSAGRLMAAEDRIEHSFGGEGPCWVLGLLAERHIPSYSSSIRRSDISHIS